MEVGQLNSTFDDQQTPDDAEIRIRICDLDGNELDRSQVNFVTTERVSPAGDGPPAVVYIDARCNLVRRQDA